MCEHFVNLNGWRIGNIKRLDNILRFICYRGKKVELNYIHSDDKLFFSRFYHILSRLSFFLLSQINYYRLVIKSLIQICINKRDPEANQKEREI